MLVNFIWNLDTYDIVRWASYIVCCDIVPSGIVTSGTRTGFLVCTWFVLVHTGMYRLCTLMYETSKYIPVCTEYVPEQSHAYWTQIEALIQCWNTTACMSRIHSIVSYSHRTQKNSLRNILVITVHTSMYWYILSSYLDIPVDQHVLSMVNGAL